MTLSIYFILHPSYFRLPCTPSLTVGLPPRGALQKNPAGRDDVRERAQFFERRVVERRVRLDDGHRLAAALASAQVEAADVDAAVAKDCSDATDDARHVFVARQEHVARGLGLDAEAVNLRHAPVRTLAEESARDGVLARSRSHARAHRLARFDYSAVALRDRDADAALLRDDEGVDGVHARAHVPQKPREERARHRRRVEVRGLARVLYLDAAHRLVNQLRLKAAQSLGQPQVRFESLQLLRADRGHVDRAAHRARKSTRLNSSHDQISYAVFCLKKKNR